MLDAIATGVCPIINAARGVHRVGEKTLIGASGEYSDFQHIIAMLEEEHQYDVNMDDGFQRSPAEFYNMLRATMYNHRSESEKTLQECHFDAFDQTYG